VARAPTAWLAAEHRRIAREYSRIVRGLEREYGPATRMVELQRTPDDDLRPVQEMTTLMRVAGLLVQAGSYEEGWVDHPPLVWVAGDGTLLVASTTACTSCDPPPSFTTFGFDAAVTGPSITVRAMRAPAEVVEPLRTVREWWCLCTSDRADGPAQCLDGEAACAAVERSVAASMIVCQPYGVGRSPQMLLPRAEWREVAPHAFEAPAGCAALVDFIDDGNAGD
jgi:hypothetical protein